MWSQVHFVVLWKCFLNVCFICGVCLVSYLIHSIKKKWFCEVKLISTNKKKVKKKILILQKEAKFIIHLIDFVLGRSMLCCLMSLFPSMLTPGMWPGPEFLVPARTVGLRDSPWSPQMISKYRWGCGAQGRVSSTCSQSLVLRWQGWGILFLYLTKLFQQMGI